LHQLKLAATLTASQSRQQRHRKLLQKYNSAQGIEIHPHQPASCMSIIFNVFVVLFQNKCFIFSGKHAIAPGRL